MFSPKEIWEMIREALFAFLLIAACFWIGAQLYVLINMVFVLYNNGFFD